MKILENINIIVYLYTMFKDDEMILIRECLMQQVNEDFKKYRKHSENSMKILLVVKKIDLFMGIKVQ